MTSVELRKLLGASQQEWMRLLGRHRMTVIRTEKGATRPSADYVRFHAAMETVIQQSLRKTSSARRKESPAPTLPNELTALFYEKEALLLSLQAQLAQVQRRYQEAARALEVLDALHPSDLPEIKGVRVAQWLNVQKIRTRKKARNNSPSVQLRLEMSMVAARAIRDEVHRRLVEMGHPPVPFDQLPRQRIRARKPIK